MKKAFITAVAVMACLALSVPAFAVQDDGVMSQHIAEADGTTGQDTNIGNGVKTGHIQDSAVTTSKIADGAVTDAKITGPISAGKISSAGLDADTVDGLHGSDLAPAVHNHDGVYSPASHNHDAVYQKKYGKIAVVAKSGGDYTDPYTAMNDRQTWCGFPTASNPCLLKIMPGEYNIGANVLYVQSYMDIEGSGEGVTRIVGTIDYSANAVLFVTSEAEARYLTVENIGDAASPNDAYAIKTAGNARLTNVTAKASNGPHITTGFHITNSSPRLTNVTVELNCPSGSSCNGMNIWGHTNQPTSVPVLNNVTVTTSGGGQNRAFSIYWNTAPVMNNVVVTATDGTYNYAIDYWADGTLVMNNVTATSSDYGLYKTGTGTIEARNSRIEGGVNSVFNDYGSLNMAVSQVVGPVGGTGTFKCFNVFDSNFDAVVCP